MSFHLLQKAQFILAAHRIDQLPPDKGAEVAFAGRSNAGKSSALNALTGQRGLARTSKTPGRTQQMVAFQVPVVPSSQAPGLTPWRLIDLPGYGYAKVPVALREHWRQTIDAYLRQRQSLRGVILITDSRHPLKEFDQMMLAFCTQIRLPCHVLLSKADKLSRQQAAQALTALRRHADEAGWHATAQLFSSSSRLGVAEAQTKLLALLGQPATGSNAV